MMVWGGGVRLRGEKEEVKGQKKDGSQEFIRGTPLIVMPMVKHIHAYYVRSRSRRSFRSRPDLGVFDLVTT